jgi:beta-glucosidase-like glycosyl hydrolase
MAHAFVGGLQTKRIAATAKHFPGLGLASGNTDNGRIVIEPQPGSSPRPAAVPERGRPACSS